MLFGDQGPKMETLEEVVIEGEHTASKGPGHDDLGFTKQAGLKRRTFPVEGRLAANRCSVYRLA